MILAGAVRSVPGSLPTKIETNCPADQTRRMMMFR
jgi:hypothetical protein